MSRAWNAFNRLLVERPVLTKAVVSGALFSTGDLIGQKIDGTWDKGYDVKRAARGFAWSACIFTPIAHVWYNKILEKTFAARGPLFKVLLDQGTFGPVMNAVRWKCPKWMVESVFLWLLFNHTPIGSWASCTDPGTTPILSVMYIFNLYFDVIALS